MKYLNYKKIATYLIAIVFIFLISSIFADIAMARPGGGHSYSGGGSGGSGGGGGDGMAELIIMLFLSLPPEISVPLVIIILIVYFISKRKQKINPTIASTPTYENRSASVSQVDKKITQLQSFDSGFSKTLFLDFVVSLYNKYYSYIGKPEVKNIAPFFSESLIQQIKAVTVKREVNEIVVGSIAIKDIWLNGEQTTIITDLDANYTLINDGKPTRYIVQERWMLTRKQGVLSANPEKLQILACPNCGAPSNFTDQGECTYCNTIISKGAMQWYVSDRAVLSQQVYKTDSLLTYSEEIGTNYPTIVQAGISAVSSRFAQTHQTNWDAFWHDFQNSIVKPYFLRIFDAWSRLKWLDVRHLVSDRLWESNNFWQNAYKSAGYQNRLENITISRIDLARLDLDKYYESVTVRIFAGAHDYVTNKAGKVIAGTNRNIRYFTEYWTFIRRTGVTQQHFDLATCPSCGAPADKMGQAGECEYCGAKITTGNFSWVLAVITQDEVYKG